MLSAINRELTLDQMDIPKTKRILWLCNHTTLREFEAKLIHSLGFEIYTPKTIPEIIFNWSGSVDYSYDHTLTIPKDELDQLNQHNFYEDPITPEIASIINRRFRIVFCIFYPKMLMKLLENFKGHIILRAFGLQEDLSYFSIMEANYGSAFAHLLEEVSSRFWFAQSYPNLDIVEHALIKMRSVNLPLGLPESFYKHTSTWTGDEKKILFFCSRINSSADYYGKIYKDFKNHFGDLPHTIAGVQPISVDDVNVQGEQPREKIEEWLRTHAVMFYHSQEPRHLHYHPLEAIVFGMPLIYMKGGMLEKLGGEFQPGACDSFDEAKIKIKKILDGDQHFIAEVVQHQKELLKTFSLEFNQPEWENFLNQLACDNRILWLINHTTLREFEVPLLRSLGYEIYTPKNVPSLIYEWSGSVDHSYDASLTIPREDLEILNQHNFYDDPLTPTIAAILNRHFGTAICVFYPKLLNQMFKHFEKRIVLRAFGLDSQSSYSEKMKLILGRSFEPLLEKALNRFWFAQTYPNLDMIEPTVIKNRSITLPLGIPETINQHRDTWHAGINKILFFCPRIRSSAPYYGEIYKTFKKYFGDLPYTVAGAQPKPVNDPKVAGLQPRSTIESWLRSYKVMFYHSQEPRHLHYHPLEAIVFGMPLIYMKGGLLSKLGGKDQPGACNNYKEARKKVKRILDDDQKFISEVIEAQKSILETFSADYCRDAWEKIFEKDVINCRTTFIPEKKLKTIGVFLPAGYQGGSLAGAKNIAKMLHLGSKLAGDQVQVIFSCAIDKYNIQNEFADLIKLGIQIRETIWQMIPQDKLALGHELSLKEIKIDYPLYSLPTDGISNFQDCDTWLIISDRFEAPIAPMKPYGMIIYDYIQRYQPQVIPEDFNDYPFFYSARQADFVLTTTPMTREDAIQYGGIHPNRVFLAPMEFNPFKSDEVIPANYKFDYFIWPTNSAAHKNHLATVEALEIYYSKYKGRLKVLMTGYKTEHFDYKKQDRDREHIPFVTVSDFVERSRFCKKNLKILGNLSNEEFISTLAGAKFLLHPASIDNGTYSVIEAAYRGIPSVSSNYPQMQYINKRFRLNLCFFDSTDPKDIAAKLKMMEEQYELRKANLPSQQFLDQFNYENTASEFWNLVRSLI